MPYVWRFSHPVVTPPANRICWDSLLVQLQKYKVLTTYPAGLALAELILQLFS